MKSSQDKYLLGQKPNPAGYQLCSVNGLLLFSRYASFFPTAPAPAKPPKEMMSPIFWREEFSSQP